LKPVKSYDFPQLTDAQDYTFRNYHAIQYVDKQKGSVLVCTKDHIFRFNLKTNQLETAAKKHSLEKICNLNIWKNYMIFCPASSNVMFMNKNENIQSYKSDESFCGDFSGGYNAFSRNSEIYQNFFFFIDVSHNLRFLDMKKELMEKDCAKNSIFVKGGSFV
jgi:hypothetical protein